MARRRIPHKPFDPQPGKPGARVTWVHLTAGCSTSGVWRTGLVVGGAGLTAPGHTKPLWVVPDMPFPSDPYDGGVVVAQTTKAASWSLPVAVVEAGRDAWFSDDAGPTGDLGRANAVRSGRVQHAGRWAFAA